MKKLIAVAAVMVSAIYCNGQTDANKSANNLPVTSPSVTNGDTSKYALLFVYRPKNFVGAVIGYDLKVSDSIVGRVKNNSKFIVRLYKEGKTEIWAKTEAKSSVNINVEYGKQYYLKCGIVMGALVGRPDLNLIDSEQGEGEYKKVKDHK